MACLVGRVSLVVLTVLALVWFPFMRVLGRKTGLSYA